MIKYKRISKCGGKRNVDNYILPTVDETMSNRAIAAMIEQEVGIPSIRTMSVLSAYFSMVQKLLLNSCSVKIDEFGTLRTSLGEENNKPFIRKVTLLPDPSFKKEIKEAEFEEVQD